MIAVELHLVLVAAAASLLVAFGARAVRWLLEWRRVFVMMGRLPGPPALPLIGNLLYFDRDFSKLYKKARDLFADFPVIFRFWFATIPVVLLNDPRDIQHLCSPMKYVGKSKHFNNVVQIALKGGLTVLDSKTWRVHRKAIMHTFHQDILVGFVQSFYENSQWFVQQLEKKADEGVAFNVTPLCGLVAGRTVVETLMASSNEDVSERERDDLVAAVQHVTEQSGKRILKAQPWLLIDWVYRLTQDYAELKVASKMIEDVCMHLIRNKRQELAKAGDVVRKGKRLTFLDYMIASREDSILNDEELVDETRMLLIGATGTSMDVMTFMLHVLSVRPDLQDKIVQELRDVLGEDMNRPVLASDLPHLGAVERFVKETLRYFPPVPMLAREVAEDIALPSGHTLPRGSTVAIFAAAVHHNSRLWPDPERFDPDRFLPENSHDRHPCSFIPFSVGPRNCIAHRYAMMFLVTQMAAVLRRVQVLPAPGVDPDLGHVPITTSLTMSFTGGARICTARRKPATRGALSPQLAVQ